VLGLDRVQAMQALTYVVMALFITSGVVSARYRRQMGWAAFGLYGVAAVVALVWVGAWLAGAGR